MYIAVEAGNTEIVNLLLSYPNIDPNLRSVFINFFFIKFQIIIFLNII